MRGVNGTTSANKLLFLVELASLLTKDVRILDDAVTTEHGAWKTGIARVVHRRVPIRENVNL